MAAVANKKIHLRRILRPLILWGHFLLPNAIDINTPTIVNASAQCPDISVQLICGVMALPPSPVHKKTKYRKGRPDAEPKSKAVYELLKEGRGHIKYRQQSVNESRRSLRRRLKRSRILSPTFLGFRIRRGYAQRHGVSVLSGAPSP